MKELIAKYELELDYPVYIKRSKSDELRYEFSIDDASVVVLLIPDEGRKGKLQSERLWTLAVNYIAISVSLPETEEPPPADIIPRDDYGSYFDIEQYFDKRFKRYSDVAEVVYLRLLKFLKYEIGTPFLFNINNATGDLLPTWLDENGEEIWKTRNKVISVPWSPGWSKNEFGIKKLRKSDDKKLLSALKNDVDVTLYQEIMYEGQAAVLKNNYRRAILEMAIACEIAVKQTFFAESTVSGLAYEYLEDQKRINVRAIDLISKVAEYVFGENFKLVNQKAYKDIDHLFRCRNKIAHRGQVIYRDDSGVWHQPDRNTLRNWWISIEEMFVWLEKKKREIS